MRRTKVTQIYKKTGNLRAVQLLLGHTKMDSTVRYLGVELEDAWRYLRPSKSNNPGPRFQAAHSGHSFGPQQMAAPSPFCKSSARRMSALMMRSKEISKPSDGF